MNTRSQQLAARIRGISALLPVRVIEQDVAVRDSIASLLELCGLSVLGYASGAAFLDDFRSQETRCILCAAELPDIRGVELFQQVVAQAPQLPFALLASRRLRDTLDEARQIGIRSVINKPMIDTGELLHFVGIEEPAIER